MLCQVWDNCFPGISEMFLNDFSLIFSVSRFDFSVFTNNIYRVYNITNMLYVQVAEVPCVIEAGIEALSKTKQAVQLLKSIGAYDDVEKAKESKKVHF